MKDSDQQYILQPQFYLEIRVHTYGFKLSAMLNTTVAP
jgi:hypothetical protein